MAVYRGVSFPCPDVFCPCPDVFCPPIQTHFPFVRTRHRPSPYTLLPGRFASPENSLTLSSLPPHTHLPCPIYAKRPGGLSSPGRVCRALKHGENRAASCSPALRRSTIGATGLNFSVRNGKRWDTGAIATQKWDLIQGDTRLSVCDSRSFEPSAAPSGADGDTGGTVPGAPRTKLSGN